MGAGLSSFANGGVELESMSWGGRISALGLGFFILLSLSMYTANLTNILVSSSVSVDVPSRFYSYVFVLLHVFPSVTR